MGDLAARDSQTDGPPGSLPGNYMHGWRVILCLHAAMSPESEKRKGGEEDLGFMDCCGELTLHEWIGVMTLFLGSTGVHLYSVPTYLSGREGLYWAEPAAQVDRKKDRPNVPFWNTLTIEQGLLHWFVCQASGLLVVLQRKRRIDSASSGLEVSVWASAWEMLDVVWRITIQ